VHKKFLKSIKTITNIKKRKIGFILDTKETSHTEGQKRFLKCNGKSYDITNETGSGLVEKVQELARENGISRFDIYDSNEKNLSPEDIETGNFTGDLLLKIENLE
jgi:hypothetical protein